LWLYRLRRLNGPNFTWPLLMFAGALPEELMGRLGKIYIGKPMKTKKRKQLLASIRPNYWRYLRTDNGDMPEGYTPAALQPEPVRLQVLPTSS
jgi:hypothetical protein